MDIYKEFFSYLKQNYLVENGDSILLAVSGGPDSLAMFDLFCRVSDEIGLDLSVFHLNHLMRKEAKNDADFVASICKEYEIDFFLEEVDVPEYVDRKGLSPEEGARKKRFECMNRIANKHLIDKVSLGHNKDDQVETVLLNLFRGAGLKGLSGISPVSYWKGMEIIHPLLIFSREDIEKYCDFRNLSPCIDKTNKQKIYTRNKVRHSVIPAIEKEIN